jgi:hypothetical protein
MTDSSKHDSFPSAEAVALQLLEYCRSHGWAGWDPYDALNSRLFRACRFLNIKFARIALTQLLKRSPINLRPLLLVERGVNPKGIALFLSSAVKLIRLGLLPDDRLVKELTEKLLGLASHDNGFAGWGYHFDWQTRRALVTKGSPNLICTTFAGNALLDSYTYSGDTHALDAAVRAGHFILARLYQKISESESFFNYYIQEISRVHNANLLGAAFLCRVAQITGDNSLLAPALKAARFSAAHQHSNGAWDYGELSFQKWIDNFHTGFNLCALRQIDLAAATSEFEPHIKLGFDFYRRSFFEKDSMPKYYHNRLYPIDIHSAAQSIITLITLRDLHSDTLQLANNVLVWTLSNMWNKRGYFYYQKLPAFMNRISYMRWSQAWMLSALSSMIVELRATDNQSACHAVRRESPLVV